MHLGLLVRSTHFLFAISGFSSLDSFEKGQETENKSLRSEGEDTNDDEQLQNLCESRIKQSLREVKFSSREMFAKYVRKAAPQESAD